MTDDEFYEKYTPSRTQQAISNAFSKLFSAIDGGIDFIADQFAEVKPLDRVKTADDVIRYANSIQHRDPNFAAELIAAANRSQD